jgi:regulatory protein YycH of two-component signal transduction system YycFG
MKLSKERFKSFILFLLVATSFVLTTRIWFSPIEGLFVMQSKQAALPTGIFNKEELLRPGRLVVNTGANHTLLFNNEKDKVFYQSIINGSKYILQDWMINYESYQANTLPLTNLTDLRNSESVELIFENAIDIEYIRALLDVAKNPWGDVKKINSILLNPQDKCIYVVDENKGIIFRFSSSQMATGLEAEISRVERRSDFAAYVFLNDYNKETDELYGDYAIAPVSGVTMPVLTVKKEIKADLQKDTEVVQFFGNNIDNISGGVKDAEGKVIFTDREEKTLTIHPDGTLEYYKFNVASDAEKNTTLNEAIDIAVQYAANHLGLKYDFYLSNVISGSQGGRSSYILSFNYKYNGMPILTDLDSSKGSMVIETLGKEVVRYKRNVRIIEETGQKVQVKTVFEILDIVSGALNDNLSSTKGELISKLNDIYLAYVERNDSLVPVWVLNVRIEQSDGTEYNKKYVIMAEAGSGIGGQEYTVLDEKEER